MISAHIDETDAVQADGTFGLISPTMYFSTNTPAMKRSAKNAARFLSESDFERPPELHEHPIVGSDDSAEIVYVKDRYAKRKHITNEKMNYLTLYVIFECADDCQTILDWDHINAMEDFIALATEDPLWEKTCYKKARDAVMDGYGCTSEAYLNVTHYISASLTDEDI